VRGEEGLLLTSGRVAELSTVDPAVCVREGERQAKVREKGTQIDGDRGYARARVCAVRVYAWACGQPHLPHPPDNQLLSYSLALNAAISFSIFLPDIGAASIVSALLHGGRNRANTHHSITAYRIHWTLAPAKLQCCPGVYTSYMGAWRRGCIDAHGTASRCSGIERNSHSHTHTTHTTHMHT